MTDDTARAGVKFNVRVDFEWDDFGRRALAHHLGRHGRLATREECRTASYLKGVSGADDQSDEYEHCDEGCHDR